MAFWLWSGTSLVDHLEAKYDHRDVGGGDGACESAPSHHLLTASGYM